MFEQLKVENNEQWMDYYITEWGKIGNFVVYFQFLIEKYTNSRQISM